MGYLDTKSYKKIKSIYYSDKKTSCWVCGKKTKLNIHHLNYDHIGYEDFTDVVVLCGKHHKMLHFPGGKKITKCDFEVLKKLKSNLRLIQSKIDKHNYKRSLNGKPPKQSIKTLWLKYKTTGVCQNVN